MAATGERVLREALAQRKDDLAKQLDHITSKQVRRLLEEDLQLSPKSLDAQKDIINELINEVVLGLPRQQSQAPPPADGEAKVSITPSKALKQTDPDKAGHGKRKLAEVSEADPQGASKKPRSKTKAAGKVAKVRDVSEDEEEAGSDGGSDSDDPGGRRKKSKTKDKTQKGKGKAAGGEKQRSNKKPKKKHQGDSEEEQDEEEEEDGSGSDGSSGGSDSDDHDTRKKKSAKTSKAAGAAPASRRYGAEVEKLKGICKQATITIPPSVYRGGDESAVVRALEALLSKHGLSGRSERGAIQRCAERLKRERELDGIDMSNIIETEGRGRPSRRAAAAAVRVVQQQLRAAEASSEEEEEDGGSDEDEPRGKGNGRGAAGAKKSAASGRGRGQQGKGKLDSGSEEEGGEEGEEQVDAAAGKSGGGDNRRARRRRRRRRCHLQRGRRQRVPAVPPLWSQRRRRRRRRKEKGKKQTHWVMTATSARAGPRRQRESQRRSGQRWWRVRVRLRRVRCLIPKRTRRTRTLRLTAMTSERVNWLTVGDGGASTAHKESRARSAVIA